MFDLFFWDVCLTIPIEYYCYCYYHCIGINPRYALKTVAEPAFVDNRIPIAIHLAQDHDISHDLEVD